MSLIVRTAGRRNGRSAGRFARRCARSTPRLAIFNVKTMEQVVADSLWELNLYRWLIGLFATLALVLAAIGLYGVISYNVTSRTREFAVRLALGSEPMGLARLVLTHGAWLTAAGLAAGVLGALAVRPCSRRCRPASAGMPRRMRRSRRCCSRSHSPRASSRRSASPA